jgi:hypothetical protein
VRPGERQRAEQSARARILTAPIPPHPSFPAALFRVFDVDSDGFISAEDLRKSLVMMAGQSLSPTACEAVIARTLQQTDRDGDGRISPEDFRASMALYPWDTFTVPVKKTSREQYFMHLDEGSQQAMRAGSSTNNLATLE